MKHQGPGYVDQVVYRFIPEHQTRLATLEKGEVDLIGRAPGPDIARLREDKRFVVYLNMFKGAPTMFLVNAAKPPTNEVAVRQAMLYAINREAVVKAVTFGVSTAAYGPLKPSIWPYWKGVEEMYRTIPPRPASSSIRPGWKPGADGIRVKDGQRLKTVVTVKDDPQALDMLQVMQANLKQVGMELEIRPMALAASEDLARKGENGMTFMDWRGTDPDILTLHYHSKNIGGWNMGWFKDPAMDKLLDDAREEMNRAQAAEDVRGRPEVHHGAGRHVPAVQPGPAGRGRGGGQGAGLRREQLLRALRRLDGPLDEVPPGAGARPGSRRLATRPSDPERHRHPAALDERRRDRGERQLGAVAVQERRPLDRRAPDLGHEGAGEVAHEALPPRRRPLEPVGERRRDRRAARASGAAAVAPSSSAKGQRSSRRRQTRAPRSPKTARSPQG